MEGLQLVAPWLTQNLAAEHEPKDSPAQELSGLDLGREGLQAKQLVDPWLTQNLAAERLIELRQLYI